MALKHERPIDEATFKTKPVDQEATLLLGLCLAPWTSGSILGMDGRVCGHVPCPACTVVHEGQTMCRCCANRARARGTQVHGAGRLPPAIPHRVQPASRAQTRPPDTARRARSRSRTRRDSRDRRASPAPAREAPDRRASSARAREEPARRTGSAHAPEAPSLPPPSRKKAGTLEPSPEGRK